MASLRGEFHSVPDKSLERHKSDESIIKNGKFQVRGTTTIVGDIFHRGCAVAIVSLGLKSLNVPED